MGLQENVGGRMPSTAKKDKTVKNGLADII